MCIRDRFKASELRKLRDKHPEAAVLVHPESPADVIEQADVVGSTTQLIKAVHDLPNNTFIVATDKGIFYKMHQSAPGKQLIEAPTGGIGASCGSCAHCPWMAMNGLQNLADSLEQGTNEVHVDPEIGRQAQVSVQRMLDFAAELNTGATGESNLASPA